jgi:hypothetical protein
MRSFLFWACKIDGNAIAPAVTDEARKKLRRVRSNWEGIEFIRRALELFSFKPPFAYFVVLSSDTFMT